MKYLLILIMTLGCFSKDYSPDGLLEEFINKRLDNSADKDYLLNVTHGKLNAALKEMSEEEITDFSELKKFEKESFNVSHRQCTEDSCFLTYILRYKHNNGAEKTTSEVKKIAELKKIGSDWKIVDVTNIKTYFEMNDAINPFEDKQ